MAITTELPAAPSGPTYRRIGGLAAPMALANAFALGSQWIIVVIIGRFGAEALYVRALYLPVSFIFAAFQVGIDVSALVAVARARASGDPRPVSTVVRPLMAAGIVVIALMALLMAAGAGPFCSVLGVLPGARSSFVPFLRLMCLAVVLEIPYLVLAGVLRGCGRTGAASLVSVSAMVTQIGGVVVLGGTLGLGITGVPVAVIVSAAVGVTVAALLLRRSGLLHDTIGRPGGARSSGDRAGDARTALGVLASVGVPVGGTFVLLFLVNGATVRVLGRFGEAAVSGFGIGNITQTLVIVPAIGLGTAIAILINQATGADRAVVVPLTVRRGAVIAIILYAILGALLWSLAGTIARLTAPDPAVGTVAETFLRFVGPTLACVGIMLAMLTLLEQTGSGFVALSFNVVYFAASIGIGAALAYRANAYDRLFYTMAVANVVALIAIVPVVAHRMRHLTRDPTGEEAVDRFETLVRTVLELTSDDPAGEVSQATHGQWTSIKHVQLILTIEDAYDVSFSGEEMAAAVSVARLREMLADKGVAA